MLGVCLDEVDVHVSQGLSEGSAPTTIADFSNLNDLAEANLDERTSEHAHDLDESAGGISTSHTSLPFLFLTFRRAVNPSCGFSVPQIHQ